MEPIRPIEPRSRWESPLAPAAPERDRSKIGQRERREPSAGAARKRRTRPPGPAEEQCGPEDERGEGRHVDVRA
jgi:hypothetical protein